MNIPSPNAKRQSSSRSSISSIRTTSTRTLRLSSPAPSTLALPTVTSISASSASNPESPPSTVSVAEDTPTSSFFMRSALQKDNDTIRVRQAEIERNRARGNGKGKGKGRDRTWVTSEFGGEGGGEAGIFLGKRRLMESPLEEVPPIQDQVGVSTTVSVSATSPPPPSSSSVQTTISSVSTPIALPSDVSHEVESVAGPVRAVEPATIPIVTKQHSWFPWSSSLQNIPSSNTDSTSKGSDMTGIGSTPLTSSSTTSSPSIPTTETTDIQVSDTGQAGTPNTSESVTESTPTIESTQPSVQKASLKTANSLAWLHPSRLGQLQVPSILRSESPKENPSHVEPMSHRNPSDGLSNEVEVNVSSETDVMAVQGEAPTPPIVELSPAKGRWLWSNKNELAHQSNPLPNVQAPVDPPQSSENLDPEPVGTVVSEDMDRKEPPKEVSLPASEVRYSEWWSYIGYGQTKNTPALPREEASLSADMPEQPSVVDEQTGKPTETIQQETCPIVDTPSNTLPDKPTPATVSTSSYLNPISWVWSSSTPASVSVPTSMPTIPSEDAVSSLDPEMSTPAAPPPPLSSALPITTSLPVSSHPQSDTTPIPTSTSYSSWLSTLTPAQFRAKESVLSSSSSSVVDGPKTPAVIRKEDTLPSEMAELPQAIAVPASHNHVESNLGERKDIRQKSSLSMLANKLRLSPSSPNLASVPSSDPSTINTGPTILRAKDALSERLASSVPTSRRQSMLGPRPPPNLVLPTFSDIFDRPPRSTPLRRLPDRSSQLTASNSTGRVKKRTLAKNAISSLTAYVYGSKSTNTPEDATASREPGPTEIPDTQHLLDPELKELPRTLAVQLGLKGGDEEGKTLGVEGIKRVVVIGVHGWFPNAIVRYIAGEPTGTSVAFAKKMVKIAESYFGEGTLEKITAIPLEGEGKVEHRVDRLFKEYMSNPDWVDDLRSADAVLAATHSQGCPVSTYLIERLYAQGHISSASNQPAVEELGRQLGLAKGAREARKLPKVLMLGLCGVHLGPLAYLSSSSVVMPYIQYFENAAAHQLFEFQDTESATSKSYTQSLSNVLDQGCKLVYVASLNDQVVPVYSAIFSVAHHPNILRVLHIDGVAYDVSDFVTKLLTFCLQLHNAGLSDGGLVAHLSEAVAAGLTGIGHSTAYGEDSTYLLAIRYLFETTSSPVPAGSLEVDEFLASEDRNGYEIPWILRGIMEDPSVLKYFGKDLEELRRSFDRWDPKTAKMKDLRRKLEPLRSRKSRRTNGQAASVPPPEPNVPTAPLIPSTVESTDRPLVEIVQNSTNPLINGSLNRDW